MQNFYVSVKENLKVRITQNFDLNNWAMAILYITRDTNLREQLENSTYGQIRLRLEAPA
jgi:hypothetical protein